MNINFKDKKTIALMITAGTLILLTAAIVAIVFLFPAKKIEIPDFSNKTKVDVDAWILENDLTVEDVTFTYEYNETTEKDMVLSQSILAGEKLKKDEVLNIVLSNGYDPTLVVTIPDFKDMKYEEIHQWFTDNKFTDVTYEYIPDQKVKKDYFIKSNLTSNEAHRNDMILVSISVGTESVGVEITMPDFADYTKANIQAWGKTNNMSITFKTEASDKIAKDKVISQTPKAGEVTKTGGKVTITISTGKGTTAIKFNGKTKKDVDTWAKENGIKISYEEEYDNDVANGIIMSNTPNSGIIKAGSTMNVKYSIGKPIVENYTNKSKDSFIAHKDALNKKGADIKVTIIEVQSDKNPGTILKQIINTKTVTASTTVNTGTTVTIEVAKAKPTPVPTATPTPKPTPTPTPIPQVDVVNKIGEKNPCGDKDTCTIGDIFYKVVKSADDKAEKGTVIDQNPKSGKINKGGTVELTLSKGNIVDPTPTPTPTPTSTPEQPTVANVPNYSKQSLGKGSYQATVEYLPTLFTSFTNLKFVKIDNPDDGLPDGTVLNVSVSPGQKDVPINQEITFEILNKK